jgi:hypothetical protein
MRNKRVKYVHLRPGDILPELGALPAYKAVVVIEADVSQMWQWEVSRWLVSSGCRYMLAWGKECSSWDDSVDEANLEAFEYEEIPEDRFVMTTWHDDEDLSEVFWFAKHCAHHQAHDFQESVILHISEESRREELEEMARRSLL